MGGVGRFVAGGDGGGDQSCPGGIRGLSGYHSGGLLIEDRLKTDQPKSASFA